MDLCAILHVGMQDGTHACVVSEPLGNYIFYSNYNDCPPSLSDLQTALEFLRFLSKSNAEFCHIGWHVSQNVTFHIFYIDFFSGFGHLNNKSTFWNFLIHSTLRGVLKTFFNVILSSYPVSNNSQLACY